MLKFAKALAQFLKGNLTLEKFLEAVNAAADLFGPAWAEALRQQVAAIRAFDAALGGRPTPTAPVFAAGADQEIEDLSEVVASHVAELEGTRHNALPLLPLAHVAGQILLMLLRRRLAA